jgi:hypothetical protein
METTLSSSVSSLTMIQIVDELGESLVTLKKAFDTKSQAHSLTRTGGHPVVTIGDTFLIIQATYFGDNNSSSNDKDNELGNNKRSKKSVNKGKAITASGGGAGGSDSLCNLSRLLEYLMSISASDMLLCPQDPINYPTFLRACLYFKRLKYGDKAMDTVEFSNHYRTGTHTQYNSSGSVRFQDTHNTSTKFDFQMPYPPGGLADDKNTSAGAVSTEDDKDYVRRMRIEKYRHESEVLKEIGNSFSSLSPYIKEAEEDISKADSKQSSTTQTREHIGSKQATSHQHEHSEHIVSKPVLHAAATPASAPAQPSHREHIGSKPTPPPSHEAAPIPTTGVHPLNLPHVADNSRLTTVLNSVMKFDSTHRCCHLSDDGDNGTDKVEFPVGHVTFQQRFYLSDKHTVYCKPDKVRQMRCTIRPVHTPTHATNDGNTNFKALPYYHFVDKNQWPQLLMFWHVIQSVSYVLMHTTLNAAVSAQPTQATGNTNVYSGVCSLPAADVKAVAALTLELKTKFTSMSIEQ